MIKPEKILITINRDLMWKHYQWYIANNPRVRTYPFCSKITEKQWLKNGEPKMTKSGKSQASKTRSRKLSEITKENLKYSVLSLNDLLPIDSRPYNSLKKKWGELGIWIAEYYGLAGKMYENALVEMVVYSETKAKKDGDNIIGGSKIFNDSLYTQSRMFPDDNYTILNPWITSCDYDKENPRLEIRLTIFDKSIKNHYDKMKTHIDLWQEENN